MMPAPASVMTVCSFPATCAGLGGFMSQTTIPPSRQLQPRWRRSRRDDAMDVGRAARVEEDMALADGRLLREQAVGQQRLADGLRELALIAREAARQVGEVGVIAAPLAHPV